jgi:hypothetical protein
MKRNSKRTVDTAEYKKRRRIRYEIIIQNTGDSKLANKARSWSDDRILRELGYYVPKRIKHHKIQSPKPVIIPIIPTTRPKKPRKLTKKQIADQAKRQHYLEAKKRRKAKIMNLRIPMWAEWSGKDKDTYYQTNPTWHWLTNEARRVNKLNGIQNDPGENFSDDSEGYTIVYNAFIHQEKVSDWIEKTTFIGFDHEEYIVKEITGRSNR